MNARAPIARRVRGAGYLSKLKVRVDRRLSPVIGLLFSVSGSPGPGGKSFSHSLCATSCCGEDVDRALRHGMRTALGIKWRKAVEEAVMDHTLVEEDFR